MAAPASHLDPVRQASPPVARTYDFGGVFEVPTWYGARADIAQRPPRQARKRRAPDLPARVSHRHAMRTLASAGLRWHSSGRCADRRVSSCTSLENVRSRTLEEIVKLKQDSGCPITVTGGTEAGHAPGFFSHARGYKLDIAHNPCIDAYIMDRHRQVGARTDGARLYRAPGGTVFANESDHWDILFR
ncbi:hypothetical protein [Thermoactinospora rubra]|uniref:hypothetical protein n=1 Tax=Thermoactinospora rubra TaxID=1088767 RepID=UPI000A1036BB|nr:hypothetical protein [Thermoactinospora rubra]